VALGEIGGQTGRLTGETVQGLADPLGLGGQFFDPDYGTLGRASRPVENDHSLVDTASIGHGRSPVRIIPSPPTRSHMEGGGVSPASERFTYSKFTGLAQPGSD
jgi:hypothetical protein